MPITETVLDDGHLGEPTMGGLHDRQSKQWEQSPRDGRPQDMPAKPFGLARLWVVSTGEGLGWRLWIPRFLLPFPCLCVSATLGEDFFFFSFCSVLGLSGAV